MENRELTKKRSKRGARISTWLVVGVIILILLLLFWVDIADLLGFGDGAASIMPIRLIFGNVI